LLFYAALRPADSAAWVALALMMQLEVLFAWLTCRALGCKWRARDILAAEFWTLWRVLVWVISLLPGSVTWSGKTWHGPRLAT
jgi:hypothetical protein